MAYSSIVKPTEYFNTIIYTGDGTSNRNITGFGFQPDWLWQKTTNQTFNHYWFDSARGNSSVLKSNSTDAQDTSTTGFNGFISDGFNVSQVTGWEMNNSSLSVEYANWCWRGAGSTASNGNGSITSSVSANTTSGFSIVSYTGNSTAGATVGHGLTSAPKFVIGKAINTGGEDWFTGNSSSGFDKYIKINSDHAAQTFSGVFNDTAPSSTVVTLGSNGIANSSSYNYIMYCFSEVKGYSKIGSYTGNGNADGTFVYTGFKPAFLIVKISSGQNEWTMRDNKRDVDNSTNHTLYPNLNSAEAGGSGEGIDFLSNGFKLRLSAGSLNGSGSTYIYLAFAENPFVANDSGTAVPVVAR